MNYIENSGIEHLRTTKSNHEIQEHLNPTRNVSNTDERSNRSEVRKISVLQLRVKMHM